MDVVCLVVVCCKSCCMRSFAVRALMSLAGPGIHSRIQSRKFWHYTVHRRVTSGRSSGERPRSLVSVILPSRIRMGRLVFSGFYAADSAGKYFMTHTVL